MTVATGLRHETDVSLTRGVRWRGIEPLRVVGTGDRSSPAGGTGELVWRERLPRVLLDGPARQAGHKQLAGEQPLVLEGLLVGEIEGGEHEPRAQH